MEISFDSAKDAKNIRERGIPFSDAEFFDFDSALVVEDTRKRYPEARYQALGYIRDRLHILVFSRTDDGIRVISLRKANDREVRRYESQT